MPGVNLWSQQETENQMDENLERPELTPGPDLPNWEMVSEPESHSSATPGSSATNPPPPPFIPAGAYPPPHKSNKAFLIGAGVTAAAILLGAGVGHSIWPASSPAPSATSTPGNEFQIPGSNQGGGSSSSTLPKGITAAQVKALAGKVSPSLVDINTNLQYQGSQAAGTGIVMSKNGLILTNNHVINGATSITARDIGNGKTYKATVVGYNRTSDIAVLQLQSASGLTVANFGDSKTATVGQAVVGIGNAQGAGGDPSTAAGNITALHQQITASDETGGNTETLQGLIQTNAPIQPGDSGGSLVNTNAEVIGIDTAASTGQSFTNASSQGFAIPINNALTIAHQIIKGEASSTVHIGETGFLGVEVQPASSGSNGFTNPFGSGNSGQGTTASGVQVAGTLSGSPAANAGLAQGDVITTVNGVTVTTPAQLTATLGRYHPGDTVTLTWITPSGTTQSAKITLETGPAA